MNSKLAVMSTLSLASVKTWWVFLQQDGVMVIIETLKSKAQCLAPCFSTDILPLNISSMFNLLLKKKILKKHDSTSLNNN